MYDIIAKKKRGEELLAEEIEFFVNGYTSSEIPDYQASSLLMAICLKGMNDTEASVMTMAIASSGDTVELGELYPLSADKHSTGGVGDKTTLIVAPIAAALGCKIAKMSGRGLGHTGGNRPLYQQFLRVSPHLRSVWRPAVPGQPDGGSYRYVQIRLADCG